MFIADDKYIYSGGKDKVIQVWEHDESLVNKVDSSVKDADEESEEVKGEKPYPTSASKKSG